MRPVNLIPPEDRRGERAPLRRGPLGYAIVGVLVLAFVGVYALVSTGNSISEGEAQVDVLEQELASSQATTEALQSFSDFAALEEARSQTVTQLATSRFDWERVLRELTLVLPEGITLGQVTGSASQAGGGANDSESLGSPHMILTGCADDQATVAQMVAALRDIDGVTRVGLASSATPSNAVDSTTAPAETSATTEGSAGSADCAAPRTTTFEMTVAFDGAAAGVPAGATPPDAGAPPSGEQPAGTPEQQAIDESIDSATQKSNKAVDQFVPGA